MEQDWNRKTLLRLMVAESEVVNDFFDSFVDIIYTWMYYQVGADPEIALELTQRALCQSLQNLAEFDPSQESFLQWLRGQAKIARDEGLLQRQIMPQRPWAWSQIPDPILQSLSQLRSEPLDDEVVCNPYVMEIAQASLVELEQHDCELMVHRYNHLDIPEHIAEEMNITVEEIDDKLYRCRHSFRRVFFQLIASSNPGFSESNATGSMDILDGNLEKLLSATIIFQPITDKQRSILGEHVYQAANEAVNRHPIPKRKFSPNAILASVVVALVLAVIAGVFVLTRPLPESEEPTAAVNNSNAKKPEAETRQANSHKPDEIKEELERILMLVRAQNLEGLLEILKSGKSTSQFAAPFVGQMGDESAIGLLEEAEGKWYPNGPDDNPFAEAIIAIEERLFPDTNDMLVDEAEIEPVEKPEPVKQEPEIAPIPSLAGVVTDLSGQPVTGAQIEVYRNPLFENTMRLDELATAESNSQGQYQIADSMQGAIWVHCKLQDDVTTDYKRSLWCQTDILRINNIGGLPALTGTVVLGDQLLVDQNIYLSDTLDPANAAFFVETMIHSEGTFTFLGVQPGMYYLFKGPEPLMRLSQIDVSTANLLNIVLDLRLRSVKVTLDVEMDPDGPQIVHSLLMYSLDMTPEAYRASALKEADGTYVFDDILPGSYYLMTMLDNEIWIQQEVEILAGSDEQTVMLDQIPVGQVTLSGQFIAPSPVDLFLMNTNQQLRIPLVARADSSYQTDLIPADSYRLATIVHGLTVEFMEIDLQNETEMILDLDPRQIIHSASPLYVAVVDSAGQMISDAQVWLTGGSETITTQSSGRGAFLAAPAGEYTLYAVLPGQPAVEKPVVIQEMSLLVQPNSDNTVMLQLSNQ